MGGGSSSDDCSSPHDFAASELCDQQCFVLDGLVGEGANGHVYHSHGGYAIKGIISNSNCKGAEIEFTDQLLIYNAFQKSQIANKIEVSHPKQFCNKKKKYKIKLGTTTKTYSCFISMSLLNQIPKEMMDVAAPGAIATAFDPVWWQSLPNGHPVTVHATMKKGDGKFQKSTGGGSLKKAKKAGRGYFIDPSSAWEPDGPFDILTKKHKFSITKDQANYLVGYSFSFFVHDLQLQPNDVEWGFGYYPHNGGWKVEIWDFGMVRPLDQWSMSVNIMGGSMPKGFFSAVKKECEFVAPDKWSKGMEDLFLKAISSDLGESYANANDDEFKKGWNDAKNGVVDVTSLGGYKIHDLVVEDRLSIAVDTSKHKGIIIEEEDGLSAMDIRSKTKLGRQAGYGDYYVEDLADNSYGAGVYQSDNNYGHGYGYYGSESNVAMYGLMVVDVMVFLFVMTVLCCLIGAIFGYIGSMIMSKDARDLENDKRKRYAQIQAEEEI
eukprot:405792_1